MNLIFRLFFYLRVPRLVYGEYCKKYTKEAPISFTYDTTLKLPIWVHQKLDCFRTKN